MRSGCSPPPTRWSPRRGWRRSSRASPCRRGSACRGDWRKARRCSARGLVSEETARLLGKRRRALFLDVLKRRESEAARLLERLPWMAIDALVPSLVTHNLARPELRAAVGEELGAVLAELSKQTIGELLDDLGLR